MIPVSFTLTLYRRRYAISIPKSQSATSKKVFERKFSHYPTLTEALFSESTVGSLRNILFN